VCRQWPLGINIDVCRRQQGGEEEEEEEEEEAAREKKHAGGPLPPLCFRENKINSSGRLPSLPRLPDPRVRFWRCV